MPVTGGGRSISESGPNQLSTTTVGVAMNTGLSRNDSNDVQKRDPYTGP